MPFNFVQKKILFCWDLHANSNIIKERSLVALNHKVVDFKSMQKDLTFWLVTK